VINAIKFSIEEIEASDQYFDHTGAVTTWPPGHPKGVELHKLQARKRTALISSARFGRRRAFQEDALRGFLQ
jgi:hypothetical protein